MKESHSDEEIYLPAPGNRQELQLPYQSLLIRLQSPQQVNVAAYLPQNYLEPHQIVVMPSGSQMRHELHGQDHLADLVRLGDPLQRLVLYDQTPY